MHISQVSFANYRAIPYSLLLNFAIASMFFRIISIYMKYIGFGLILFAVMDYNSKCNSASIGFFFHLLFVILCICVFHFDSTRFESICLFVYYILFLSLSLSRFLSLSPSLSALLSFRVLLICLARFVKYIVFNKCRKLYAIEMRITQNNVYEC